MKALLTVAELEKNPVPYLQLPAYFLVESLSSSITMVAAKSHCDAGYRPDDVAGVLSLGGKKHEDRLFASSDSVHYSIYITTTRIILG